VEWTDQNGKTYDALGPVPSQYFDQQWENGNIQASIREHLEKANYVPIDVTGLTAQQVTQVQAFVAPLGPSVFLVGQ